MSPRIVPRAFPRGFRRGAAPTNTLRYDAAVDLAQGPIVRAARSFGATVQKLQLVGAGCPDLLVGYRGRNYLVECKTVRARRDRPRKKGGYEIERGRLNPKQRAWAGSWAGQWAVAYSAWDLARIIGVPEDEVLAVLGPEPAGGVVHGY